MHVLPAVHLPRSFAWHDVIRAASKNVESAMKRRKRGMQKSGGSGKAVKSRKQAIAIGLSEARSKGKRVPKKASRKRKAS
jgi:hypothetical protein